MQDCSVEEKKKPSMLDYITQTVRDYTTGFW